ncbi:hypothetical protein [Catenulispora subtropica]|uniref:Flagellar FliJ protein n=1 Tax=Catenulispora subtropica TaxID=450798 RepID=A0ABP5ELY0_9ACTN
MGQRWIRKRQAAYRQLVRQISEREAVHEAEEIVGAAWMAGLVEAEGQAATARRVCTHMRDSAYEVYRSAKAGSDAQRLSESYRELAASQQALCRVRERHEGLRRFAERERAAWFEAERTRALEVLADRDRLAEAARAAGMEEERTHEHR